MNSRYGYATMLEDNKWNTIYNGPSQRKITVKNKKELMTAFKDAQIPFTETIITLKRESGTTEYKLYFGEGDKYEIKAFKKAINKIKRIRMDVFSK